MSYVPNSNNYYTNINLLENGERANRTTFNRPLSQIADNIAYIKSQLDSLQTNYDSRYELKITTKRSGFNLDIATNADIAVNNLVGKLARADDPRFNAQGVPAEHTHDIEDINPTGLAENTFLFVSGGKISSALPQVGWTGILNRPSFFPTNVANVAGLTELLGLYSPSGHSHGINDIRNLDSELTVIKNNLSSLNNAASSYAPLNHTQEISTLRATSSPTGYLLYVDGNLIKTKAPPDPNAQLPLDGQNGQFVTMAGGSVVWDTIKISNVVSLQTALNGKANASHTHSVTDITIPAGNNGKYLFVDNSGQVSLIPGPGQGGNVPDEFIISIPVNLTANSSQVYTVDIPSTRLYGVALRTSGAVKNLQVELLGQVASDVQYLSVFTDTLTEDLAQAWRFRDRTGTGKMRVRVTNKDTVGFDGTIQITAEPF